MSDSSEQDKQTRHRISGWLRQSRHRARHSGTFTDITFEQVWNVYEHYNHLCAYCGEEARHLEHPFPIRDDGPCVQSNILPCCKNCKAKKGSSGLLEFYKQGYIGKDKLQLIVQDMLKFKHSSKVKTHMRNKIEKDGGNRGRS